jgi:hypothetical protein
VEQRPRLRRACGVRGAATRCSPSRTGERARASRGREERTRPSASWTARRRRRSSAR